MDNQLNLVDYLISHRIRGIHRITSPINDDHAGLESAELHQLHGAPCGVIGEKR